MEAQTEITETATPTPTTTPTPASTSKIKLCVICCAGFNSASIIQSDAILCREHLVSFCKLLANSPPRQNPEFDALLQKSFPGMDAFFEESGMSVCVDCHHQITVAMEKGAEAEKKEEEVRKLQLQILQQMKELQKQVNEFHEEMTKVEKTIQTSDVSCLMYHMAKNPSKNEGATNGIVLIRDRILDVMADLRDFQARQKTALDFDLETLLNLHAVVTGDAVPVTEGDDDDFIPFIPAPDVIIGTEGLLEAAGVAPMFFGHTIFGNDGDFRFEAGTKNNGVQEGDSDFSKSDAEMDSSDSEVSIHSDASLERMERKRLKYGGKIPETLNPTKMATAITAASSGPAVGVPTVPAPQLLTHLTTPGPIGPLKKDIIDRCERRKHCRSKQDDLSLDPLVRYPLQYDPATDKLTINGFEIIVDESYRVLKCGTCGFARRENKRSGGSLDIEWKLKVHIMSAHVGFICTAPGCNFKCQDHHQFIRHLRSGKHGIQSSQPQANNSVQSKPSAVPTRSSPRQAPPPPPPPPPALLKIKAEKPKPSTPSPTPSTSNGRSRSKIRMPQGDARVSATTVRMCPVSNCGRTFAKKEDFIRHLQGHRNQNKWRREQQKMRMEKKSEEPEIVTLD